MLQRDLFGAGKLRRKRRGHRKLRATARVAYQAAAARAATDLALQVLAAVRGAGTAGLTSHECAERLGLSILTTAPRLTELLAAAEIRDSGQRRRNASGRNATVWVAAR